MRLLLDTHVLIWAFSDPARISDAWRDAITDRNNEIFYSAASIWEVAIKTSLRRADFVIDADELIDEAAATGFREMPVAARIAAHVQRLPRIHGDPFDRLLVAQALAEPCILLTANRTLQAYSELIRLV
jgi:PIN domain nuclease of toxin-antitoxin system